MGELVLEGFVEILGCKKGEEYDTQFSGRMKQATANT